MKTPDKILRKIELYCILHNTKNRNFDTIPHHCSTCSKKVRVGVQYCGIKKEETFAFLIDINFKKFIDVSAKILSTFSEETLNTFRVYHGCEKWKKRK